MIFISPPGDNQPNQLERPDLQKLINFNSQLRSKARNFITEHKENRCDVEEEEIFFEDDNNGGKVVWRFQKNTACHCHPEYQEFTEEFPLIKFYEWLEAKNELEFWF